MSQFGSICRRLSENVERAKVEEVLAILKITVDIVFGVLDYSYGDIRKMLYSARLHGEEKNAIIDNFIQIFDQYY